MNEKIFVELMDDFWSTISNPEISNDDIVAAIRKLPNDKRFNCLTDMKNSAGLCVIEMMLLLPERTPLLKEFNIKSSDFARAVFNDASGTSIFDQFAIDDDPQRLFSLLESLDKNEMNQIDFKKLMLIYRFEHFEEIMGSLDDQAFDVLGIIHHIKEYIDQDAAVALNLIGPQKLDLILSCYEQYIDNIEGEKEKDAGKKAIATLFENWGQIVLGCHLDVLNVIAKQLPPAQWNWINPQVFKSLVNSEKDCSNTVPNWFTGLNYNKGIWPHYKKQLLRGGLYKDSVQQRVKKIGFVREQLGNTEALKKILKEVDPLEIAAITNQPEIARALLVNFGQVVLNNESVYAAIESENFETLASMFMACDSIQLSTVLLKGIRGNDGHVCRLIDLICLTMIRRKEIEKNLGHAYRKKHQPRYKEAMSLFVEGQKKSRVAMLCEKYLNKSDRFANYIAKMFQDICANRTYLTLKEVHGDLHIEKFRAALNKFSLNLSYGKIHEQLNQLYNSDWCTIYHYNAIFTYMSTHYEKREDWARILLQVRSYAQHKVEKELVVCTSDSKDLHEICSDQATHIIGMRQKHMLTWLRHEPIFTLNKTTSLSRIFSSPQYLEKLVRKELAKLEHLSRKTSSLYYLCDVRSGLE